MDDEEIFMGCALSSVVIALVVNLVLWGVIIWAIIKVVGAFT